MDKSYLSALEEQAYSLSIPLQKSLPDVLVLSTSRIVSKYKENLEVSWLFTVDLQSIVSLVISCYYFVPNAPIELEKLVNSITPDFLETKAANSFIQVEYVVCVLKSLIRELSTYMEEAGFLQYEYLPFNFDRLLQSGDIVLRKK